MKKIILLMALLISTVVAIASEEEFLEWTSVAIRCGKTREAGDVSCEMNIEENDWKKFVIQAFGKSHALNAADLKKLKEFPLSSLRTSHVGGDKRPGGHTVCFRFDRAFYNPDRKLVTEIICVSVTKKGVTVSTSKTVEHKAEQ